MYVYYNNKNRDGNNTDNMEENKMNIYKVTKWDGKNDTMITDYGKYNESDVKLITRGYKANTMEWDDNMVIYTRKNSRYYYVAEKV